MSLQALIEKLKAEIGTDEEHGEFVSSEFYVNEILKLCEAAEVMMNSLIIYKDWGKGLSPQETLEIANSICGDKP